MTTIHHTVTVREYIAVNYEPLKTKFIKSLNIKGLKFDEDIFHSTLEKCMNYEFNSNDELENYLFVSLLTNIKRDKLYHYNSKRADMEESPNIHTSSNMEALADLNIIKDLLYSKFKKEDVDMFLLHSEGYSILELENKYNIKNLTYKINKIKRFLKF